jgi:hypothetical protein
VLTSPAPAMRCKSPCRRELTWCSPAAQGLPFWTFLTPLIHDIFPQTKCVQHPSHIISRCSLSRSLSPTRATQHTRLRATPASLARYVTAEDFYQWANKVQASLVRVDADELTYPLHIVIRFELEEALMQGKLQVADLPAAWNAKYKEYLGVEPTTDKEGVLQVRVYMLGRLGPPLLPA